MKKLLLILTLMILSLSAYADNNSERGPEWLDGTWRFKGDIDTFFGVQNVSAVLTIDWKNQELLAVTTTSGKGGGTRISGHYKVYNGAIHVDSEQYYIKIDYTNKRLEFGNGMYYEKENNGPKPTPTPKGKKFVNTNKNQTIKGSGWATPTNSRYADYKSYDLKIKGDRIVGYGSNFSNSFKSCDAPFYELTAEDRKEQKLTDNQGRSYEMYVTRCKYIAYINGLTFYFNIQNEGSSLEKSKNEPLQRKVDNAKVDNAKEAVLSNIKSHFKINEFNEALQHNDMIKYIVNFNMEYSKSLEIGNSDVKTTPNLSKISNKFWEGMMKFLDKNTFKIKEEYAVSSLILTMAFESQNNDLINYILTKKAGYKRKSLKKSDSKKNFELIYGNYKTSISTEELFEELTSLKKDAVNEQEKAMIDQAIAFCKKEFRKLESKNNIDKTQKRYYYKKTYTPSYSHSEFESEVTTFDLNYTPRSIKLADLNEICVKFIGANHPYYYAFDRHILSIASGNGNSIENLNYVYPIFINSVTPLNIYTYYYNARETKVY